MGRHCILIVEPDTALRERTADLITRMRVQVLQAADGDQALTLIESSEPDLVLCTRDIEGHSVKELCDYVHDFSPGCTAFALVLPDDDTDPDAARVAIGADLVFVRPLSDRQLKTVLSLLLELGDLQARVDHLQEENLALRQDNRACAVQDPITRFYRFDLFKHIILIEIRKAKRYGYPVSILLLAFDKYHDVAGWLSPEQRDGLFGHLREAVVGTIRDIDIPLMFAEEKVMVVMPHTGLSSAVVVADRIRARVNEIQPPKSLARIAVTASLAVASTDDEGEVSFGRMVQKAMRGLAEAEIKGGDVVVVCASPKDGEGGASDPEAGGQMGPRTYFV